jgi:DNA-binding MarR family transcriptional regulator
MGMLAKERLCASSPTDLAVALSMNPSTASRLRNHLVAKRLIGRQRARGDRREVCITLSAAGRRVVGQVTQRRREWAFGWGA